MHRVCAALLAALAWAGSADAGKPEATFALAKGWVEFRIEQDGSPASGATVEVFDAVGAPVANGETGEGGEGSFPKPAGHTCRLLVTVKGKACDSVLLLFDGPASVRPARVQLTFGDRSCCKTTGHVLSSFGEGEGEPARPVWPYAAAGGGCLAVAGLVLGLSLKRRVPLT